MVCQLPVADICHILLFFLRICSCLGTARAGPPLHRGWRLSQAHFFCRCSAAHASGFFHPVMEKRLQPNLSTASAPERLLLDVLRRTETNIRAVSQNCGSTTLLRCSLLPHGWWPTAQCQHAEHCSYMLLPPLMLYSLSLTHPYPLLLEWKGFM